MNLNIVKYDDTFKDRWDSFVLGQSVNGTFLQTRNFLDYHPKGRFEEASLLIMNGSNIIAVIPAHKNAEQGMETFYSHKGSTFGGIVLGKTAYNISYLEAVMPLLEEYIAQEGYEYIIMKSTPDLFSKEPMGLLDYEFFKNGYRQYDEISFYLKCGDIPEDGMSMMTSSRRRDCRYSLKNGFTLKELKSDEEVEQFYLVLCENLRKFDTIPVHNCDELIDFKNNRLKSIIKFFGVFEKEKMAAGSMLFAFGNDVLHTQYLACLPEYNRKYIMNFMDYSLILISKKNGYRYFSFGTSTGKNSRELNLGLALYKEGFGCSYGVNRTYTKLLKQ